MNKLIGISLALITTAATLTANATPINIDLLPNDGSTPTTLGGYTMTPFAQEPIPSGGCDAWGDGSSDGVTQTGNSTTGIVQFVASDHATPLCMSVQNNPDWWQWDHGNVFTTHVNWVELILPADTRAFSLHVGAVSGRGWIDGIDHNGNSVRHRFGGSSGVPFGWDKTPGFGVHVGDSCGSISRIVIEPWEWGTGNFAINRGACTQVPEPAPIALLGLGLLGIAFTRSMRLKRQRQNV
jgi:hypothetical protein